MTSQVSSGNLAGGWIVSREVKLSIFSGSTLVTQVCMLYTKQDFGSVADSFLNCWISSNDRNNADWLSGKTRLLNLIEGDAMRPGRPCCVFGSPWSCYANGLGSVESCLRMVIVSCLWLAWLPQNGTFFFLRLHTVLLQLEFVQGNLDVELPAGTYSCIAILPNFYAYFLRDCSVVSKVFHLHTQQTFKTFMPNLSNTVRLEPIVICFHCLWINFRLKTSLETFLSHRSSYLVQLVLYFPGDLPQRISTHMCQFLHLILRGRLASSCTKAKLATLVHPHR